MDIILRAARVIHPGSPYHNKVVDILIASGKIKKIATKIADAGRAKEIKAPNLHVSMGWVDMNVNLYDPGYEQKETVESGCRAAAAGGFTHICVMPGSQPVTQSKAQVDYLINKSKDNIVSVHPVGALTHDLQGKDLADMYDMHRAGAIAFSDGLKASPSGGMIERALLYVKAFDGLVMNHPEDKSISKNGMMNEGVVSTRLGLPGAPALAEEIAVNRDIYLLDYTESRLHLLDISVAGSVALIKAAKKKNQSLTASVNAYNLFLDETAVGQYDTNCKVNPHLRSKADINALIKGVTEGTIDTITSQHNPQDEECKKLEFDKADYGMIGLETSYAVANTALQGKADATKMVELMSLNARRILGLPVSGFAEGAEADLTIFDPEKKWTFTEKDIRSQSKNTPFVGTALTGKVVGVIHKDKMTLTDGKI
ncbi:MAG: dihydroorotase [Bacteroidetes bacterium]|nr:dihydroorotase [Bacteroidota bacterium]